MWCRRIALAVLLLLGVGVGAGIYYAPEISDCVARYVLANAVPPDDLEYPNTPQFQRAGSDEWTPLGGQGKGLNCSIPSGLEWLAFRNSGSTPVSLRYRQACVAHDLCYRHGAAAYGYTQADCDLMLIRAAFRLCRERRKDQQSLTAQEKAQKDERCINAARKVYAGVFAGGARSFRGQQPPQAMAGLSTPVEFDSFPAGTARYAVPRLVRSGKNGASLYFFLQRPGGSAYSRFDWDGRKLVRKARGQPLPGRYRGLVAPPMVARAGVGEAAEDLFLWWRRQSEESHSTGGWVELARGSKLETLPPSAEGTFIDPGSTQFHPVAGSSPDGRIHLIGVGIFSGAWEGCTPSSGLQIVHVAVQPAKSGDAKVDCRIYSIKGPATSQEVGNSRGSFLVGQPVVEFRGRDIEVHLFSRGGESDYQKSAATITARFPAGGAGASDLPSVRRCWSIEEAAEPLLPIKRTNGTLALAGFIYLVGGKPVDPDEHEKAAPVLQVFTPSEAGTCVRQAVAAHAMAPGFRDYLQGRMVHLRYDVTGGKAKQQDVKDLLILTSFGLDPNSNGFSLNASVLLLWFADGGFRGCDKIALGRIGKAASAADVWKQASGIFPLAGNLDGDGLPDFVLADGGSGDRSLGFVGVAAPRGRLTFRREGRVLPVQSAPECTAA